MKLSDCIPSTKLAAQSGIKMVTYGPPGSAKTPLISTAPRPFACIVEPGTGSLKKTTQFPCWIADTVPKIIEFFEWVFRSTEAKQFDTIAIDSFTEMCELFLLEAEQKNKDGRAAYKDLRTVVMNYSRAIFNFQNKHFYLIHKEETLLENNLTVKRPYLPGQALKVELPHLFDIVTRVARVSIPGLQGKQLAFQTFDDNDIIRCRNRFGNTDKFEPANLTTFFNKCMS